ncbi:hypothetical protein ACLOJK_040116 [Asimina triloba]
MGRITDCSASFSVQSMELFQIYLCLLLSFLNFHYLLSASAPLNCSDTARLCTSFLAFKPRPDQPLSIIQSMFDVVPGDVTVEDGDGQGYLFIKKNCSCLQRVNSYLTNTTFTVRAAEGDVYGMVAEAYGPLAFLANSSRRARAGAVVSLRLLCGCSSGLWNYLLSYVMGDGDTIGSLASRFGVSMDSIEAVNGISDPDNVSVGDVYYIPLNSGESQFLTLLICPTRREKIPGQPYPVKEGVSPAPAPADSVSTVSGFAPDASKDKLSQSKMMNGRLFCFGGGNSKEYLCCKSVDWKPTTGDTSNHQIHVPKAMMTDVLNMEKPVVFRYEEILSSTDAFSESSLLGHGRYGSVYFAVLQDQEVAIKRMTATKTKEFMAEMKVLSKVHHANLVELIGYAASNDELFLVYEYSHKGSLRSHLHDPQSKGNTSLSWISRVQIALDTARGLEYIHEHTKAHYVHRDIKTSNILLDSSFRAKISDFGLAKLVGRTSEGEASTTRVVGTFGYLAPEYLSDGLATTKSDVYAFGVVLFELISGKEAITRTEAKVLVNPERRSLASISSSLLDTTGQNVIKRIGNEVSCFLQQGKESRMFDGYFENHLFLLFPSEEAFLGRLFYHFSGNSMLAALRNCPNSMSMANLIECIDPNLMDLYPHDCAYKMAMLAKQCVDEDPILRPDMKEVVISLSQILLSSVEWEATLAGNSQEGDDESVTFSAIFFSLYVVVCIVAEGGNLPIVTSLLSKNLSLFVKVVFFGGVHLSHRPIALEQGLQNAGSGSVVEIINLVGLRSFSMVNVRWEIRSDHPSGATVSTTVPCRIFGTMHAPVVG